MRRLAAGLAMGLAARPQAGPTRGLMRGLVAALLAWQNRAKGPYHGECRRVLISPGPVRLRDLPRSGVAMGVLRTGGKGACTENAWPQR